MIGYNDLYELLRKEKYAETLQQLPKSFLNDFSAFLNERKGADDGQNDLFADSVLRSKKQFENAIAIFKELILRRKRKLLNLVFVATETGIMKRDYENMLEHERVVFDKLVKSFEEGDKELAKNLSGKKHEEEKHKMILFNQDVEQFVDFEGKVIGPYASGELANLDVNVAAVLVSGGKAGYVDSD